MKKTITLIAIVLQLIGIGGKGWAQTTFEYTYDSAGNRTARAVVTLKAANIDTTQIVAYDTVNENNPSVNNEQAKKNTQGGVQGETTVALYPNPTAGAVELVLDNFENQPAVEIWVFDLKGSLLFKKSSAVKQTRIDLINQPAGIYIAKIIVDGKVTECKIIKE